MYEHKTEIRTTRVGCLGSSDGSMLSKIASLGSVPRSAYDRLAVCKGLVPQEDIPETNAIRMGNEIEMQIFEYLKASDSRWMSNVRLESKKYSKKNFKLITHPDFFLEDEDTKTIYVSECKATKMSIEQTRGMYAPQIYIHYIIALEYATSKGREWKVNVSLVHYDTNGLDLSIVNEFDAKRLTVRHLRPTTMFFDVERAVNIVDDFLGGFNEYYRGDEIPSEYLPQEVQKKFELIASYIADIKRKEKEIDEFKARLYDFMVEKDIRGSIRGDSFTISRVDPTETVSFDHKKYIEDMKTEHPRLAMKLLKKYAKTTKRSGYAQIRVKETKE